ncbi:MAG: hypothetical protein K6F58_04495 [Bacteroidales bacterium]|nr:hypothetical protein [Bacteroidales bacterium]
MKRLSYIFTAALLLIAGACDSLVDKVLVVDEAYDIDKVSTEMTVVPGITVAYEVPPFSLDVNMLVGEATSGENSFLKAAPDNDPVFRAGDLLFRQSANPKDISPKKADIFENTGTKAEFVKPMAVYMVDVPGMLNISNQYTLTNPCIKLEFTSDLVHQMKFDMNLSVAGTVIPLTDIPFTAKASQTVFVSAAGGYAKADGESDFLVPQLSALVSPLPYEITILSIVFHKDDAVADPAYGPTDVANISLLPSFILPADFKNPSRFGSSLDLSNAIRISAKKDGDYKVDIHSISAHFEATNTLPLDLSIVGQPNDSVSISVPVIKAGSLDAPVKTEGDIVLSFLSYSSISSLVPEIAASAPTTPGATAQLNVNQGLTFAIKSITIPDGVDVEILKK